MPTLTTSRLAATLPIALVALVLAGCTALGTDDEGNSGGDAAAIKFVACLNGEGQTAKIINDGQVGVLMPEMGDADAGGLTMGTEAGAEGGEPVMISVFQDEEGAWLAGSSSEAYPEEGGYREAWTACEADVPEFTQPQPDMSEAIMMGREEMIEAGLTFAACTRDNGYADFEDPDADGLLSVPFGITEDEFRSLLEACFDEETGFGPAFSQESTEALDFDWITVMSEFMGGAGMVAVPAQPVSP